MAITPRRPDASPLDSGPGAPRHQRFLQTGGSRHPHLLDYLRVLSKRRWAALTVFVAVTGLVALYTWTVTPRYEARVQLMIETERPRLVIFKESIEQGTESIDYQQTQHRILQSRGLARRTIDALNLWKNPELLGEQVPSSRMASALNRVVSVGETLVARFSKSAPAAAPAEARSADESAQQARVIDAFLSAVTVTPVRNTRLVDVKFRSEDPELAASVTNALATAYIEQNLEFKSMSAKESSDWLTAQLEEQRRQVEQSEETLQRYRERTASISTNERENLGLQKLAELNSALTRARTERIQREATYRQVEAIENNPGALESWPAVVANASVQVARSELEQARRQSTQLTEKLGAKHPDMVAAERTAAVADAKYKGEVVKVVASIRSEYNSAKALEDSLAAAVEMQKREALVVRGKEIEYDALERDAISDRQIFESLLQRTKEAGVSGELPSNNIRVVDPADVPRTPVSPRKERNLLLALLAGVMLAVGVAFVKDYFDKAINSPNQIKEQLGLPCLGLVPLVTSRFGSSARPSIKSGAPSHFIEAFRTIRTNVLFSSDGEQTRTILVTSTGPHEGKTIVTCNLAMALAQTGQEVLLIDADMRRPRVHQVFETELEGGLSEITAGDGEPDKFVRPSGAPHLSLITAGRVPNNPHELLSSPQFKRALARLSDRFDWILIDTPPIMPVSDAALVAHTAAGVLFVVGSELTTVPSALNALEQLEAANARFVGAVLNMAQLDRHAFFYADHYRAEYKDYYTSTPAVRSASASVSSRQTASDPILRP